MSKTFAPEFVEMLREVAGDSADKILDALNSPASVSIRLNPMKLRESPFPSAEKISWSPYGYILPERPEFTLDPLFHAGAYYVQDSSSMFVGQVFRSMLEKHFEPGTYIRVLDLCAAPGGKSTDLSASLREYCGGNYLLVCNEVMKQRAGILRDNMAIWGDPNVVVTSVDPAVLGRMESFFDVILADVPCSGEGMFRKDAKAVEDWSVDTVKLCASRQMRIVADVFPALKEGGIFLYSTCTFNRHENDLNVKRIASELGAKSLPIGFDSLFSTEVGVSLFPGLVKGEGQYCAALQKDGGCAASDKETSISKFGNMNTSVEGNMKYVRKGENEIAIPQQILSDVEELSFLRPLAAGVMTASIKNLGSKGILKVPCADLATTFGVEIPYAAVELDKHAALDFLHGDAIVLKDAPLGYILLKYKGAGIGFVKNLGKRCNNLHPLGRRIRMSIPRNITND